MANKAPGPGLLLRNAGIFNPVLVQAVGLCPVIAMATTLEGSALLALVAATAITLCELIASVFLKAVPRWVRTGLYIIFGGAIITPFMILIEKLNPELFGSLGIYLPVMAVNSLLVLRCERFAVKLSPSAALKDGLTASLGYAAVLLLVGTIREILGSGSIAGFKFYEGKTLSGLLLPFGGFLMLGFAAAALRTFISEYWPKFLDKKQPKPDAKKHRTKKPTAPKPAPELPDLTPEENPFTFLEIAGEPSPEVLELNFETTEEETPEEPVQEQLISIATEETAVIFTEEIPAEPIMAEEPVEVQEPDTADIAENLPEPEAETVDPEEVEEEPVTPEETVKHSASHSFEEVGDEELEMLLNRSVDDIFAKHKEDEK